MFKFEPSRKAKMFQDKEPDKIDQYLKKLNTPQKKDNSKSKKVSKKPSSDIMCEILKLLDKS